MFFSPLWQRRPMLLRRSGNASHLSRGTLVWDSARLHVRAWGPWISHFSWKGHFTPKQANQGNSAFLKLKRWAIFLSFQFFHPSRAYLLNLLMEVVSDFTSTLNNPFLWGSCNTTGHFIPSIVPRRWLQRKALWGTSAQGLYSPYGHY